jgi:nicotinamidase-related amidase
MAEGAHGPIKNAVHLCLDMQNIFGPAGLWATPWMAKVLPIIVSTVELAPQRTMFTRFIPPRRPENASGQWRLFYRRWEAATRSQLPAAQLELVPELQKFVPPALQCDKAGYSAFHGTALHERLRELNISTLIISGAETDVCVLATVLDAIDIGYRVIVLEDGLCSSSDPGHDALMSMYRTRYSSQIEVIDFPQLCEVWRPLP